MISGFSVEFHNKKMYVLSLFQRVVRYILKQDVPSSLEDALKVAQAYMLSDDEIYSLRIIDLIDREQVRTFPVVLSQHSLLAKSLKTQNSQIIQID